MEVGGQGHTPATFLPGKSLCTHCRGGLLDPRGVLDGFGEEEMFCPHRGLYRGPSSL